METLKSYIDNIEKIKSCFVAEKNNMEVLAMSNLKVLLRERIFKFSQGTNKQYFGQYRSESYIKKRKASEGGLQVQIKDLQFSKDFANDLSFGVDGKKNVIGFTTDRSEKIAIGQETGSKTKSGKDVKQINFPIFAPQDEEVDVIFDEYLQPYWDDVLKKCFK